MKLQITKPIRIIELFSGYGSQLLALKRLQDEGLCKVESWLAVDFDKYVINSFNAIHGTDYPVMDIKKLKGSDLRITDKDNYTYLLTLSHVKAYH